MIQILVALIIFGFVMYLVNTFVPMAQPIKMIINFIAVLLLVVWLLQMFGLIDGNQFIHTPRGRR